MIINLSPIRSDESLVVTKSGDALTVNGEEFDFSDLPNGATLPSEATNSNWFVGPIERISGTLHITLRFPHGPNPPQHVAFPTPLHVTKDGPVELPK